MKRAALALAVMFLFLAPVAFADTVILKNGQKVEGRIIETTDKEIKIDFEGVPLVYLLSEVQEANGQPVVPAAAAAAPAPTEAPAAVAAPVEKPEPLPAMQQEPMIIAPEPMTPAITQTPQAAAPAVWEPAKEIAAQKPAARQKIPKSPVSRSGKSARTPEVKYKTDFNAFPAPQAAAGLVGGIFLIIIIFTLVAYVFGSLCLFVIANKTAQGPAWLAWIPIANVYLMCKIAALPPIWMLGLLAGFIPFIGGFLVVGFSAFLWFKVAVARNKPGWLGILTIIPVVNFIVMGYLAFSD